MTEQPSGFIPQFTMGDRLRKAREIKELAVVTAAVFMVSAYLKRSRMDIPHVQFLGT